MLWLNSLSAAVLYSLADIIISWHHLNFSARGCEITNEPLWRNWLFQLFKSGLWVSSAVLWAQICSIFIVTVLVPSHSHLVDPQLYVWMVSCQFETHRHITKKKIQLLHWLAPAMGMNKHRVQATLSFQKTSHTKLELQETARASGGSLQCAVLGSLFILQIKTTFQLPRKIY